MPSGARSRDPLAIQHYVIHPASPTAPRKDHRNSCTINASGFERRGLHLFRDDAYFVLQSYWGG
jgi:hypothetical protein